MSRASRTHISSNWLLIKGLGQNTTGQREHADGFPTSAHHHLLGSRLVLIWRLRAQGGVEMASRPA